MSAPFGFLDFGSADDSIILSCRPNSLAAVQAVGGALAGTTGNARFDEDRGFYQVGIASTTAGLRWAAADVPGIQELLNHGHVTFWVEPAFLSVAGSGTQETLFQIAAASGGTTAYAARRTGNVFPNIGAAAIADGLDSGALNYETYSFYGDTRSLIPITYSWNRGVTEIYIDGCLVQRKNAGIRQDISTPPAIGFLGVWAEGRIAAPGLTGVQEAGGALHSFHFSNRPINLPFHRTKIVNFGDSITIRGGASSWTPYKMNTHATAGQHNGAGYVMGIRRLFAQHGYMMPFYNYAVGGTQSDAFATQVASFAALSITENWVGTVMFGINDASLSAVSAATFETRMIAGLDAAFTAGASKMIVLKPPSPANNPSYNTPTITGLIDAYGDVIDDLRASYPDMIVGNALAALGGHITSNPLYQTDDVHMNNNGQMALSRLVNPLVEQAVF